MSRTLYVGMTNNLQRRVFEHKEGSGSSFTSKYGLTRLVYYDILSSANAAIDAEKRIKGLKRDRKLALIEKQNAEWVDLSVDWF